MSSSENTPLIQAKHVWSDFKKFVGKGSILNLAIGIVVGETFSSVVTSFVGDIITPILSFFISNDLSESFIVLKRGEHFPYKTRLEAIKDGAVTWNYGNFLQLLLNFFLVSSSLYLVIKAIGSIRREKIQNDHLKVCPFCFEDIHFQAKKCSSCTADLDPVVDVF